MFDLFLRLLGIGKRPADKSPPASRSGSATSSQSPASARPDAAVGASPEFAASSREPVRDASPQIEPDPGAPASDQTSDTQASDTQDWNPRRLSLRPLRYQSNLVPGTEAQELVSHRPYRFACPGYRAGQFRDLSRDSDQRWLDHFRLPLIRTPDELAAWLEIPIGRLAWLTHQTTLGHRAESVGKAHYAFHWIRKRSGGVRLIEAPKPELKQVQERILRGLLDQIPAHGAAHGFVPGRSILSNAEPHLGQRFLLKFDLRDFYATVRYARVVAIFRSVGYSREVAIWLARLTTSAVPWGLKSPAQSWEMTRFRSRHLPQGAPTSPALANLSAFGLDVRLSGLARAYELEYTRYADDLTFSGSGYLVPALREFIPLVRKIIRSERFSVNYQKCRVIRDSQRQTVTGVVVNEKLNVSRADYDELKAILHNACRHGPESQNRGKHPNFSGHLRGRIAHVQQLHPARGEKLLKMYEQIHWGS